jgi:hypothetical protein
VDPSEIAAATGATRLLIGHFRVEEQPDLVRDRIDAFLRASAQTRTGKDQESVAS